MRGKAFIDVEMVGDATSVYAMLDHLDSCFSAQGQTLFMERSVVPYLRQRAVGRFNAEGDDASGKWRPLRESTVNIRSASGFGGAHPINVRTGEMERYITQGQGTVFASPEGAVLQYPDASGGGGVLKKKVAYAQGRENNPRPVLAVNETDLMEVTTQLAFFIQGTGGMNSGS